MSSIRVLIAEDDGLLRQTLSKLLGLEADILVVGEAPNGEVALQMVKTERPQVVLTDIDMPKMDGIALTRHLREDHPEIAIVVLTKFGDDEKVFSALKAGAVGYLLKDSGFEEIVAAVREAATGFGHLNAALVARVIAEFGRVSKQAAESRAAFAELTHREMEVLELLGKGMKNRIIGETLSLSEKTVKAHVGAILRKLELNDRTEAALLAQKHGLGEA